LKPVRVRFAPSPTGYLHVGGLRTALYNYLFAKKNAGTLILRIEDTDRARYVEGAVQNLLETLQWAGLSFDEGPGKEGSAGPYLQSERLSLYREHANRLVKEGKAYYAFDSAEELAEMRRDREERGLFPKYDRRALKIAPDEVQTKLDRGDPAVIRMRVPDASTIVVEDLIRGSVRFASEQIDDQVLIKSDGYPTYHLANVVDDHTMGMSHVIRGEEWLSSTPKHVLLYQFLGWDLPTFAHLPLLLNPDRSKLSKRQGDVAVEEYRNKGFLPEALVNFVALLGWNPGDEREIFTLEELIDEFSLTRVGRSGAVFDIEKLRWMNTQHFRLKSDEELFALARPQFQGAHPGTFSDAYYLSVIRLLKERAESVDDLLTLAPYFFEDPKTYDESSRKKNWSAEAAGRLATLRGELAGLDPFTHPFIEKTVRDAAASDNVGAGRLIHPLRLALTGMGRGPGLFELMEVLGREACIRRIEHAVKNLPV
jgi:glutamyl-tRNA synthetase